MLHFNKLMILIRLLEQTNKKKVSMNESDCFTNTCIFNLSDTVISLLTFQLYSNKTILVKANSDRLSCFTT